MKKTIIITIIIILLIITSVFYLYNKNKKCEINELPESIRYDWVFKKLGDNKTNIILINYYGDSKCINKKILNLGDYKGVCKEIKNNDDDFMTGDSDNTADINLNISSRIQCIYNNIGKEIRIYNRDTEEFFKIGDINISEDEKYRGGFIDLQVEW